jgi:hypothetical protein
MTTPYASAACAEEIFSSITSGERAADVGADAMAARIGRDGQRHRS